MALNPLDRLVRDMEDVKRQLAGRSQLSHSSLENSAIPVFDEDGAERLRIGAQDDGTHSVKYVQGPPPPPPTAPVVEVDGPVLRVRWDGQFQDGTAMPEDFARIDVHVEGPSTARVAGTLTTRAGSEVVLKAAEQGEHTVTLIAVSASETPSDPSEPCVVEVAFASLTGAIEAVVGSANGINRITYATRPPGPEDEGKPGDTWWVNEEREHPDTNETYIAITEQWQYTDTGWAPVALAHEVIASVDLGTATVGFLHGQRIVAGTVMTEQLAATAIDGMVITGAVFQTAEQDPRGLFDRDGIRFTDGDGTPTVQLTPHPETMQGDFLGLRGADGEMIFNVSEDGTMSSRGMSVENDPTVMGKQLLGTQAEFSHPTEREVDGMLDFLPRGMIARAFRDITDRTSVTNEEMEVLEYSYQHEPSRAYRIVVAPFSEYVSSGAYGILNIYIRSDGSRPQMTDTPAFRQVVRNGGPNGTIFPFGGEFYSIGYMSSRTVRIMITLSAEGGTLSFFGNPLGGSLRTWVEDMGLSVPDTTIMRNGRSSQTVPTPPPEKRNYTKTYSATSGRTFWVSGGYRTDNTQYAYQGNGPYGGSQRSMIFFPNMTSDLSGAEITSVRIYLYFEHWYYSGGGTARIHLHGSASPPSSMPYLTPVTSVSKWPKPGGKWVSIPSAFWNGFQTGAYRGIGLGDASGSRTEYGYARVSASRIEVKYRK